MSQLSVSTYYGLVKLLATCAASSAEVAKALLSGEMGRVGAAPGSRWPAPNAGHWAGRLLPWRHLLWHG